MAITTNMIADKLLKRKPILNDKSPNFIQDHFVSILKSGSLIVKIMSRIESDKARESKMDNVEIQQPYFEIFFSKNLRRMNAINGIINIIIRQVIICSPMYLIYQY